MDKFAPLDLELLPQTDSVFIVKKKKKKARIYCIMADCAVLGKKTEIGQICDLCED